MKTESLEKATKEILALIAQSNQELLKRIELPKDKTMNDIMTSELRRSGSDYAEALKEQMRGYNQALHDCKAIITAIRESI